MCARRLVSSIASLVGVGVFNYFLRDVPPRKMFAWTSVLGTGLGMTQLMLITGGGWGGGWGGGEGGLSVRVWLVRGGRDPDVPPPQTRPEPRPPHMHARAWSPAPRAQA